MIINEVTFDPTVYRSVTTRPYKQCLKRLSPDEQRAADDKFLRWQSNGASVSFEPKFANYFVVEVTRKLHAICKLDGTTIVWIWIGKYTDYYSYLSALRKGGNSN